jgi:cytochrome c-550 PedF
MLVRKALVATIFSIAASVAMAHGDVTPQVVDVSTLKPLGDDMLETNPYVGDKEAIRVGSSAYNQNCARCHGLEAVSGGISPDLRKMNTECDSFAGKKAKEQCKVEIDTYYRNSVLGGKVRGDRVYMPAFAGILSQEAIWAIKAYVETRKYE